MRWSDETLNVQDWKPEPPLTFCQVAPLVVATLVLMTFRLVTTGTPFHDET